MSQINARTILIALLFIGSASAATAQETKTATIKPLFQTDLTDLPGREALMITVELPPGDPGTKHRHNAHTFVYVLEGTIEMQVDGGELKTLRAGETFYEAPDDIHVVGKNASDTEPAKMLVVFIKQKDAPPVVPVP